MEDKILLTARYVEGDMDEAERKRFEFRMQEELDLQQHLKDYTDVHQSLRIYLLNDPVEELFRDIPIHFGKSYAVEANKSVATKPLLRWLSGTVALLLTGLMIWAPWRQNLYDDYSGNSEMMIAEKGVERADHIERAAALYNNKEYAEAAQLLAASYQSSPENPVTAFYYGKTLIEINQIQKSRSVLIPVYKGTSDFRYDAAYAIALSYLKEKNQSEARIWLLKIPAATAHAEQARSLLGKI